MGSFWDELRSAGPIVGLAPMDGVTDAPFRYMVAKYGGNRSHKETPRREGVDVIFTEFVSVDGLHHAKGSARERLLKTLVRVRQIDPASRIPEVAQVFGKTPEYFAEAAELIEQLGFDGVDINMGCPAKNVAEHGSGAGLIRTPELAQQIVRAARSATKLPVSVKTRIGVLDKSEMAEWIAAIMSVKPAVLSLHGRTLKQLYTGEADWEMIAAAGEIVHEHGGIILGNGDVKSISNLQFVISKYGVDGVLIGRASFGNPGVFAGSDEPSVATRLAWMREHARVYEEVFGKDYFLPFRKHLAWYAKGFSGASELRQQLVRANSAEEVEAILRYSGEYGEL